MPGPLEGLAERLVDAAVRLVEERGWSGVTVRLVAGAAAVSYGAPVARFGDEAGLLAAVAEHGFHLLERELAATPTTSSPPRPSAALGASAVNSLGLRYVEFALQHRNLHRAMHHPDLWAHRPAQEAPSPSIARRQARSAEWHRRAVDARNKAFAHFVAAVVADQVDGTVAEGPPGEIARVVTALADGFILQAADGATERLGDVTERQLAAAERLLGWAQAGIRPPA
jgi:AcrR family transcriptional regulator